MSRLRQFVEKKSFGGLCIIGAALLAMGLRNSPLQSVYDLLGQAVFSLEVGDFTFNTSLLDSVNGGLMTFFFLLVGLELKREILEGDLSLKQHRLLPMVAAIGGVVVPALIYLFLNRHSSGALRGWAIPTATDITFALGLLALLDRRIPSGLRASLLSLAIIDDLLAIIIVSLFYTNGLSLLWVFTSFVPLAILFWGRKNPLPLLLAGGFMLWICLGLAGIPPTLAGVITALFVPLHQGGDSPLKRLEKKLYPVVTFFILPVFAFFNGGVLLQGLFSDTLFHPVTQGCFLGLFLGKPLGILFFSAISCGVGISVLPHNVTWRQYGGMAMIAGIGFTMSLYIGGLAFDGAVEQEAMRLGILLASVASAVFGCFWLYINTSAHEKRI